MKRTLLICAIVATCVAKMAAQDKTFACGADVSWCTEMEADGKSFYDTNGTQTELMTLLGSKGMTAVRLRVWVNPSTGNVVLDGVNRGPYGPWCDKADVVSKARRAKAAGLDVMIDFHYSDFFTDPGRQTKPEAWAAMSYDDLKAAVAAHTTEVLGALKAEGVEPRWVQIGNETRSGMLWPDGALDWNKSGRAVYEGYIGLTNAGYDAVKAVCPDALVIVHIDKGAEDNAWFFDALKQYGCKFDMIGLSHYPEASNWQSLNTTLATRIRTLGSRFQVPVMVVETGYYQTDEALAQQVMEDLFNKTKDLTACAGIFYWEPQLYSWWKPKFYTVVNWNSYNKGAFTSDGKPGKALQPFFDNGTNAIHGVPAFPPRSSSPSSAMPAPSPVYDLSGRELTATSRGSISIVDGHKVLTR